jgi:hypothetical protein
LISAALFPLCIPLNAGIKPRWKFHRETCVLSKRQKCRCQKKKFRVKYRHERGTHFECAER